MACSYLFLYWTINSLLYIGFRNSEPKRIQSRKIPHSCHTPPGPQVSRIRVGLEFCGVSRKRLLSLSLLLTVAVFQVVSLCFVFKIIALTEMIRSETV